MRSKATIRIRLSPNVSISETYARFNEAIQIAFRYRHLGGLKSIHKKCYKIIRKETGLPSQLACKSIRIIAQNRKVRHISNISIRYDIRNFWVNIENQIISLSTINGRIKIPIQIPTYFTRYVDWDTSGADIVRKGNRFYIHIFVSRDIKLRHGTHTVGVDVGINKLAVTSDRQFFGSVETKLKRMIYLRARLQSKGTKSAKRHLRCLSGRQKRFIRDTNHVISKQIVYNRRDTGTIVMEDIKGIQKRNRGKRLNGMFSRWAFYQLQTFIEYKAIANGIDVVYVNPRNTSKTCSKCNSIDTVRKSGFFHCNTCNHSSDADLNAALNIADLYGTCDRATVNLPIVFV